MGKYILRESLIEALQYCSVRELPKEDTGEHVYIKAIGLAAKRDGTRGYVSIVKDIDGNDEIEKDFGTTATIVKIEKVYPVVYLDGSYMPNFGSKRSKEEKINWLKVTRPERDYEKMSARELDKAVLAEAIQLHLRALKDGNYKPEEE